MFLHMPLLYGQVNYIPTLPTPSEEASNPGLALRHKVIVPNINTLPLYSRTLRGSNAYSVKMKREEEEKGKSTEWREKRNYKKESMEELQDGRRVRRGDHLPPHKYIRNTSTCGTVLNAGRRPQTSQKARNSPRTWVGKKKKENTETKE